jgi:hypothetical protein
MAIVAESLLEPQGILTPGMFPGVVDLTAHLAGYVAAAEAEAERYDVPENRTDAFVRAWAYHRALVAVATRLATTPASYSLADQGSRTYSNEQIRTARSLADKYLADALALVPVASPEGNRSPGSMFVESEFRP